ncbi:MAG TPA: fumarate hydratase [Thermoplasmatales archaeon]|nr:fumarate hydratase [Thermoplasmatales archaeon]
MNWLIDAISDLVAQAVIDLPKDVEDALKKAMENEEEPAKTQLKAVLKNIELARIHKKPMCQDTGTPTFYVKLGSDFPYKDLVEEAIIEGVRRATEKVPLRPNAVDVLTGKNSGDNTGRYIPFINWEIVEGSDCIITAMPKGGGSENMSTLKMLKPGVGLKGVKKFVLEWMVEAGGNPCPPTTVGIGIGGGADIAMKLAKKALLRKIGERHKEKKIAKMEEELLSAINSTGIGAMGLGGKTTILDVHIDIAHRHPASLPVAIAVQCWANRRKSIKIDKEGRVWNID